MIYKNVIILVISLNKKYAVCWQPLLVFKLISNSSCDDCIDRCMIRKFKDCSSSKPCRKKFNWRSTSKNDETASLSNGSNDDEKKKDGDEDLISYYECARGDESKLKKVLVKESLNECISLLKTTMTTLKRFAMIWIVVLLKMAFWYMQIVKAMKISSSAKSGVPYLVIKLSVSLSHGVIFLILTTGLHGNW